MQFHQPVHIVWFKRDFRLIDHAPLVKACNSGLVLPLFCWEPSVWAGDDYVKQHQVFTEECLLELTVALKVIGLNLLIWPLGMIDALNAIRAKMPIAAVYSHEETGNNATFIVDKTVAKWCKIHGVDWFETPQNGVVRRLKNRNDWHNHWGKRMCALQEKMPQYANAAPIITAPNINKMCLLSDDKPKRQHGGRAAGLALLASFLDGRAANFRGGISSPLTAVSAGSRLSPYLSFGCLSMREVLQATRHRRALAEETPHLFPKKLSAGLIGFESRLHWHCHFMQKLESEPAIEFENMHRAHDGMRDEILNDTESKKRLQVWTKGETGWPLVDACMAMLRATGWVNFRMRAMLMSTASYLYWLHWRAPGLHLAREFLDYEPGIHWSQTQMQSGTTGINTLRIYNPVKQAQTQDPTGAFVRHWLPQLKFVPDAWIFEPYLMPKNLQLQYGCVLEKDYPLPIVPINNAMREAKIRISEARKHPNIAVLTSTVIKKHASRKGMAGSERDAQGNMTAKRKKKATTVKLQQELF